MVDQVVLDEDMALGFKAAAGGWSTTVVPLSGGKEHRNKNWAAPRRRYEFAYSNKTPAEVRAIQSFFDDRQGSYQGWLLKDWSNYALTGELILTAAGSELTAQIIQTWGDTNAFSRTIRYIKSGTLVVYLNSSPLTEGSDYTVDSAGLITFTSALAPDDAVTVDCEFYVPVRFEQDSTMISVDGPQARWSTFPSLSAIEILE